MSKLTKGAVALIAVIGISLLSVGTVFAQGENQNFDKTRAFGKKMHMRGMGLIPKEAKQKFKSKFKVMTEEEKAKMREERKVMMQEKRAAMKEFIGLSREEMREAKKLGKNVGDVLLEQGKTIEDAEKFLTDQAEKKIEKITEVHDLSEDAEKKIRDRLTSFVQRILDRWFGNR